MNKKKRASAGVAGGVIRFFSEIYMLERIERSGWKRLAAPQESVAGHTAIGAQIACVLALMEGANAERVVTMFSVHDNDETRRGDQDRIASLYLPKKRPSLMVIQDQLRNLPEPIARKIGELISEFREQKTLEAIVAKDADWLEAALRAKILVEQGYQGAKYWIEDVKPSLKTKSAKMILAEVEQMDNFTICWWEAERERIMKEQKH